VFTQVREVSHQQSSL